MQALQNFTQRMGSLQRLPFFWKLNKCIAYSSLQQLAVGVPTEKAQRPTNADGSLGYFVLGAGAGRRGRLKEIAQ